MGKLVYSISISLDGFICDKAGNFDWAEPREDLHRYINDLESKSEILLYGRRMYEIMAAWETMDDPGYPSYIRDYQRIWKGSRKIVFSRTLRECRTADTTLRLELLAPELGKLKRETIGNISIGGAQLASRALDLGFLDEIALFVYPVLIGSGRKWIDAAFHKRLKALETKEFENDVVMVRYAVLE